MIAASLQIYYDFSGYSDMAIGMGKMFGFSFLENFNYPFISKSVAEFWRRWHMSLGSWFRDYVYIPLGGNRVGKVRQAFNLILTFLVSGLWHGANWTFVIWGGIHGCAQVLERFLSRKTKNLRSNPIAILKTLGVFLFIAFTWIFFVSKSLNDALYVIGHLFTGISSPLAYLQEGFYAFSFSKSKLLSILFFIFMLAVYDGFSLKTDCIQWISKQNKLVRNLAYWGLVLIIVFFRATVEAEFVYFQF
jgi:D-alanyl-lipoteichoic acid acyltransferase DltB (MBOAT superfamily)